MNPDRNQEIQSPRKVNRSFKSTLAFRLLMALTATGSAMTGSVDTLRSFVGGGSTRVAKACEGLDCDPTRNPVKDCERELRFSYLAGIRRDGQIIAAVTGRTAEIVVREVGIFKLRIGAENNSGVPADERTAPFGRQIPLDGKQLNLMVVPTGKRDKVLVEVHRLNTDGTRRTDPASNPPAQEVDTCAICGEKGLHTHEGLKTIQFAAQDTPYEQYKAKDLIIQDPNNLFDLDVLRAKDLIAK